ncbi:hypothetical protein JHK87_019074 [Glycine soja]|nr:hypothetical protein JHK87_019074 [Glycine soja]
MMNIRNKCFFIVKHLLHWSLFQFEDVAHKIKSSKWKGLLCYKEVSSEETLILKGISGVIFPGELLVILGTFGCGKTTLLAALGGWLNHGITRGSITYNGKPLSKPVKQNLGFVAQQDVFYPHLSISETLVFSALLRLPYGISKEDKFLKAQAIMNELDLTHCLDSTTAGRIVLTLCELAKDGRTIIMTIYQPSSKLFYMFQKILLLSDGRSLYFGKGENVMNYFSSIGYAPSVATDPTDFVLDLANGIYSENLEEDTNATKQVLLSAFESNLACQVKMELQISRDSFHHNSEDEIFGQRCTTWRQQFTILLRRGFKERKYEQFSPHKICHVLVLSFFAGFPW